MFEFYARISAPQSSVSTWWTSLAALTRLSRSQLRVFASGATWSEWGI